MRQRLLAILDVLEQPYCRSSESKPSTLLFSGAYFIYEWDCTVFLPAEKKKKNLLSVWKHDDFSSPMLLPAVRDPPRAK